MDAIPDVKELVGLSQSGYGDDYVQSGPDECSDECSGGGAGSSAAIVEVVETAECAEISGKVQIRSRMLCGDELSEEVFDDLAGGSSVAPSSQARAGLSGSDHSSEEFFGGRQVG